MTPDCDVPDDELNETDATGASSEWFGRNPSEMTDEHLRNAIEFMRLRYGEVPDDLLTEAALRKRGGQ